MSDAGSLMSLGAAAWEQGWTQRDNSESLKLATLRHASHMLLAAGELRQGLRELLEHLAAEHGASRTRVVVFDTSTGAVDAAVSAGSIAAAARDGAPDDLVRQVAGTGRAVVIPRPGGEPHAAEFAVPVTVNGATAGVLALEMPFGPGRGYDVTASFLDALAGIVAQAVAMHRLAAESRMGREPSPRSSEPRDRYGFAQLVGASTKMQEVYQQIEQVARTKTTVLVRGDTGTGKELIAHAIHHHSARAKAPFIKVNCATLPHDLIESELFGYERGAFTGAHATKKGRFELADGGTLFLDEVGELNLSTQVKLLRVLQEREFERLGSTRSLEVNIRLVAATNRNLEAAIAAGTFREDLFYRLNVFAVFVPPLRERKTDILQLANHFLEKYAHEHRKKVKRIATPAIDMLMAYHWPGNVRELENAIERAVVVCNSQVLHSHDLPPTLQTAEASGTTMQLSLEQAISAFEKDLLNDALKSARGNRAKAARLLKTTGRIFSYKVRKYGIDWRRFRS